jgi:hypothetical protein
MSSSFLRAESRDGSFVREATLIAEEQQPHGKGEPVLLTLGHDQCIFAGSQWLKPSSTQVPMAHDAITVRC